MKIRETIYDAEKGTQFYNIEEIPVHDLRLIFRLLKAEKQRAAIVKGWNRGSIELLSILEHIAKSRNW